MTTAWEIRTDDVATVLNAHGIKHTEASLEQILDDLDHDAIIDGVLYYVSMEAQTDSMLHDIEHHLIGNGTISGEAQFHDPDTDECEDFEDDDDFDFDDDFDDEEE
jgi:hypothetical protein